MSAFSLIVGSDPYDSEEDEDDEFSRPHWVVLTRLSFLSPCYRVIRVGSSCVVLYLHPP